MTTQILFRIDKKLKDRAMEKARHEGVALSSVLKLATKAFVEGALDIQLVGTTKLGSATEKRFARSLLDIQKKKNLSPAFSTADKAIRYLRKL